MHTNTQPVNRNNAQPTTAEEYILRTAPNTPEAQRIRQKYKLSKDDKPAATVRTEKHFYARIINGREVKESRRHIDALKDIIYVSGELLCVKDKRIRLFTKIVLAGLMSVVWNTKLGQPNYNKVLTTYANLAEHFHITKKWAVKVLKVLQQHEYIKVTDFECVDVYQVDEGTQHLIKQGVSAKKLGCNSNREKVKEITILKDYKYVSAQEHPVPYVRLNLEHFIRLSTVVGGNASLIYFYLYGRTKKQNKTYTDIYGNKYRYIDYKWIEDMEYMGIPYKKRTEYLKVLCDNGLIEFETGKGYRLYRLRDKLAC